MLFFLLAPNVNTMIPPSKNKIPIQEVTLSTSPTINTPNIAAVVGSASDNVSADDDGIW